LRRLVLASAALALLGGCGDRAAERAGCARTATHEVSWSSAEAPDVITATAEGPSCAQAVVTWVLRDAGGDPLWAFASTYFKMTRGGVPPEGAPEPSGEEIDRFLAGWADATEIRTSQLPVWRAEAATLTESAATFAYETPLAREGYEMLRERDLAMLCYQAALEATQCLIIDPSTHAPAMIVAYGP